MVRIPDDDSEKVFINCPYDKRYEPLLKAIIFGVTANGYNVICSKECVGGETRLEKILEMIYNCNYSIHDISRNKIDRKTKFARFNMPFELGLFISCKYFGRGKQKVKDYLILDKDEYSYRHYLSDISGKDVCKHENKSLMVLLAVNDWLGQKRRNNSGNPRDYIGSLSIQEYYKEFLKHFPVLCRDGKADINNLTYNEYIYITSKWLERKKRVVTDKKTFTIMVKKN